MHQLSPHSPPLAVRLWPGAQEGIVPFESKSDDGVVVVVTADSPWQPKNDFFRSLLDLTSLLGRLRCLYLIVRR